MFPPSPPPSSIPSLHRSLPLNPLLGPSPPLPPSIHPPPRSSPSLISPKDKHSTGCTVALSLLPPSLPPSPCRQCICSEIRTGFVPLTKEGTNQTLICRCLLCLMARRERDLPGAHAHARAHAANGPSRVKAESQPHTHT